MPRLRADVAVLTVIPAELNAAREALGIDSHARTKDPDGSVYFHGSIHSQLTGGGYEIVLGCIGGAGNPGAAAAADSIINRYQVRALLLMGIAAGIRSKVRIGDVLISERIVGYEPAALARVKGKPTVQPRPEIERAPHTMLQDVHAYRTNPNRLTEAFLRAGGKIPKAPDGKEDEFREHVACSITWRLGTVAAGEKLLRDPSILDGIRTKIHGKTEAGEMEAAGVVEACRRKNVPWLVVRGISDFGDELKDDRFHEFAARAAATVLADFVAYGLDLVATSEINSAHGVDARMLAEVSGSGALAQGHRAVAAGARGVALGQANGSVIVTGDGNSGLSGGNGEREG